MKKGTISKVRTRRQRLHGDSRTAVHKRDAKTFRKKRQEQNFIELLTGTNGGDVKFNSLGMGACFDYQMRFLSKKDWDHYIDQENENRSFYAADESQGGGRVLTRKIYLEGWSPRKRKHTKRDDRDSRIYNVAVTTRPDISLALQRLDKSGKSLRPLIKKLSKRLMRSLERESGYEVLGITVHPSDGELHFHVYYSTISKENLLLHRKTGRGTPKLPTAGFGLIGGLRKLQNGLLKGAYADELNDILESRTRDACLPLDWILSQELDGHFEIYLSQPDTPAEIKNIFKVSFEDWKLGERAIERYSPRPLSSRNRKLYYANKQARTLSPITAQELQIEPTPEAPKPSPDQGIDL